MAAKPKEYDMSTIQVTTNRSTYPISGTITTKSALFARITALFTNVAQHDSNLSEDRLRQLGDNCLILFMELSGQKVHVETVKSSDEDNTLLHNRFVEKSWIQPLSFPKQLHQVDVVDQLIIASMKACFDLACNKSGAEILNTAFFSTQSSQNRYGVYPPAFHLDTVRPFRETFKSVHTIYVTADSQQSAYLQRLYSNYIEQKKSLEGRIKQIEQPSNNRSKGNDEISKEGTNRLLFNRLNTQLAILDTLWTWIEYRNNEALTHLTTFDAHFENQQASVLSGLIPSVVTKLLFTPTGTANFPRCTLDKTIIAPSQQVEDLLEDEDDD